MPKDEWDPEDPHELMSVALPAPDAAAQEALGRALIEELVRLAYDEQEVLRIFSSSFYAGAHAVLAARGEDWVRDRIRESMALYRPMALRGADGRT
ncbi:MAG: hypothetical protein JNJ88_14695 [Planctomycetes bacterium]|nr:hypothetical protein [Planctomycetota bacterium]